MSLHCDLWGRGSRLVLAHGFTQNARCWGPVASNLAADHQLALVDLPGHGDTPELHDEADLVEAGGLLAEAGGNGIYLGYSMGGRVALHAALARPEVVTGLVLIGTTAGLDSEADRRARVEADEGLAQRLTEVGLPSFLDEWLAKPLFAGLTPSAACLDERRSNRATGLAASLRSCGTGNQEPLWDQLEKIEVPVLVIAGADDAKFEALGRRMADLLPGGEMATLPGTHAVHLESPSSTAAAIRTFVDRLSLRSE